MPDERKSAARVNRRQVVQAALFGGLAGSTAGCSFFFPVPHDSEATNEPSQSAVAMGKNFRPKETWVAEVTVEGILAGELGLTVGEVCRTAEGKRVFTIRSSGQSAGLVKALANAWSDVKTSVDASSGLPIRSVVDVYDGKTEKHFEIDFRKDHYDSIYQKAPDGKRHAQKHPTPPREPMHDVHSLIGMLRNWRPEPGTNGYFFAVSGRRLWRADLRFVGPERLDTAFGDVDAVRIDGLATRLLKTLKPANADPKAFRVWFADDEIRNPLRVWGETKIAELRADLVGYKSGDEPMVGKPPLPRPPDPATCPSLDEENPIAMYHRPRSG